MIKNSAAIDFSLFATWYETWFEGKLGNIATVAMPITTLYESYRKHCSTNQQACVTVTQFSAWLDSCAHVLTQRKAGSNCTWRVATPQSNPADVLERAERLLHPPRLIKTYASLDVSCLDDHLLAVMQTIEDGLITAGFVPGHDYTRKDLFIQAMPIIAVVHAKCLLSVTTSYPSTAAEEQQ